MLTEVNFTGIIEAQLFKGKNKEDETKQSVYFIDLLWGQLVMVVS
jgi:hypothetical protein